MERKEKNHKAIIRRLGIIMSLILFSALAVLFSNDNVYGAELTVEINEKNFPDANFRKYIKDNFDKDHNGSLSQTEIDAVYTIECGNMGISDVTGLKYFTSLYYFGCTSNNLTYLDLTYNKDLRFLYCPYNKITKLDLSKQEWLYGLKCYDNKITSLNLSKNKNLQTALVGWNPMTSLNVNGCTNLLELDASYCNLASLSLKGAPALTVARCYGNQLTSLDVTSNTALVVLQCGDNKLANLNLKSNRALVILNCYNNQLTSLDLTGNPSLNKLDCGNNKLTALNISKNTNLLDFFCYNNQLTSLNIGTNGTMVHLNCSGNKLAKLDVSGCEFLTFLRCEDNKLKKVSTAYCPLLMGLSCYQNNIKVQDISNNPFLRDVYKKDEWKYDGVIHYSSYGSYLYFDEKTSLYRDGQGPSVADRFDDVYLGEWYSDAVQYVFDEGIMVGKKKTFGINDKIKREDFVTILYSMQGKPDMSKAVNPFSDTPAAPGYPRDGILWAHQQAISNGNADGSFGVGKPIQRQAVAVMLYKYAELCGYDLTATPGCLNGFSDVSTVQAWAKTYMEWAVTQGIMSGKGGNRLDPMGFTTRAECAVMIKKLVDKNGGLKAIMGIPETIEDPLALPEELEEPEVMPEDEDKSEPEDDSEIEPEEPSKDDSEIEPEEPSKDDSEIKPEEPSEDSSEAETEA